MTGRPPILPVVCFAMALEGGYEQIDWYLSEDHFTSVTPYEIKRGRRVGALVVDVEGTIRRIIGVTDLGPGGTGWKKALRILFGCSRHVSYQFAEEAPISFSEIRDRACTSIRMDRDCWRDDEAVAGESGPPREDEDMMEEQVARIQQATNMRELVDALEAVMVR